MKLKKLALAAALLALGAAGAAQAAPSDKVVIGIITDESGPLADIDGLDGVEAMRMAVADFGGKVLGKPVEIVHADNQNKPDVAATRAREWADRGGLNMLIGGTNSAADLAITKVIAEKKSAVYFTNGAGTPALTSEECNPYHIGYAFDNTALARTTARAVVKQGGKSWFFLTVDYAFGHSLEDETAKVVKQNGGSVAGAVRHPLNSSDFSSFLLQAQNSKAQVLGLIDTGHDQATAIKTANEFGISKKMKLVGMLMDTRGVHALGDMTAGMLMTDHWYSGRSPEARKFAARFLAKTHKMPTAVHAADYSAVMTYLKAVKAVGGTDPLKIVAYLKKTPINDLYNKGVIRADGRYVHDMYMLQVKSRAEKKGAWDDLKLVQEVPGAQSFESAAESKCALLKK